MVPKEYVPIIAEGARKRPLAFLPTCRCGRIWPASKRVCDRLGESHATSRFPHHASVLGERIKALREARGLTRAELAQRIGINVGSLRKLEEGVASSPSFAHGVELARVLGAWPDEIAREKPHRSDVVFDVEGVRCELRLRVYGGHEARRRTMMALREALGTITTLPRDVQQERLDALEAELAEIYRRASDTLAEIRALREGVDGPEA